MFKSFLLSSMDRVFPNSCPENEITSLSCMRNEPTSFQLAFRAESEWSGICYAVVDSPVPVKCYRVGYVPVTNIKKGQCDAELEAGLYPDMLLPYDPDLAMREYSDPWRTIYPCGDQHQVLVTDSSWNSMFFTVNEEGKNIKAGTYEIKIYLYTCIKPELVCEKTLTLKVIPALLPKRTFYHTSWFHLDALSDYYHEEMFTDRFFDIVYDYARAAAVHGMNMILLPAFTPPLDTPIGCERKKAQLVKIKKEGSKYTFDFSLLLRFIDAAKKAGITSFEHAHLFTQWGAKATPAIYAEVGGREKRIFGWDIPSDSPKYKAFLRAYLTEFGKIMREHDLKVLFHISDEPFLPDFEFYSSCADMVRKYIGDNCMLGDALSEFEFFEKGVIRTPIVVTDHIDAFKGKCKNLWAYYTSIQSKEGFSNRTLMVSPARNRSLGYQLFAYDVKGFLHYGYNYWYDYLSHGLFDPKTDACGSSGNAASSFLVYPGHDGKPIVSMRMKVFSEALNDERALRLLEKKKGHDTCMKLLEKHFGNVTMTSAVTEPEKILAFREELNGLLG